MSQVTRIVTKTTVPCLVCPPLEVTGGAYRQWGTPFQGC